MRILFVLLVIGISTLCRAQGVADKSITAKEVERIESHLASDEMMGRRAFTPYADMAATFIAAEFNNAGLKVFPGLEGYKQEFAMVRTKFLNAKATFDGVAVDAKDIIVATSHPKLQFSNTSGYEKAYIKAGSTLQTEARKHLRSNRNMLVIVDRSFASNANTLIRMKSSMFKSDKSVVFVFSDTDPSVYEVSAEHEVTEMKLANVVGILPGKSKKDEYVVFSAHYDHIGTGKAVDGDSIYNGANDDASGVTAVIMLANYYRALNNNERTLVFAAFTAEEIGGYGSQYFSRQLNPDKVVAMFNIEMIGTESKWGKNSAFITGYEKSDMGAIMQKNLEGSAFKFEPDPYPQQNLFYRSDNATLARLGVPAHTISTSKMDSEPNYHKVSDEIETLDIPNMTEIIRAIAISARSIVAGKDSPSRVKVEDLR